MKDLKSVYTPRPSLQKLEILINSLKSENGFQFQNTDSTQIKLDEAFENLENQIQVLLQNQQSNNKNCEFCEKVTDNTQNRIKMNFHLVDIAVNNFPVNSSVTLQVMLLKNKWIKLGQSESQSVSLKTQEINFLKSIFVEYRFEEIQNLEIQLLDDHQNCFAKSQIQVSRVVGHSSRGVDIQLVSPEGFQIGRVIIKSWRADDQFETIFFKWYAKNLKNVEVEKWDKSDPYLIFYKQVGNELVKVYRTEFHQNNLNPSFRQFSIKIAALCNNDKNLPIIVKCYDWEEDDECQFIGQAQFTLQNLIDGQKQWNLKANKDEKNNNGILYLDNLSVQKFSFMDFLICGIQLHLMVAIDYTKSNGSSDQSSSLHYIKNSQQNQYQKSINMVLELILNYNHSNTIQCYGFGGIPNFKNYKSNQVEHCFNINGNPYSADVDGLEDVLQVYKQSLKYIELAGPTLFDPIFKKAKSNAEVFKQNGSIHYQILLIMTDGDIHDMNTVLETLNQSQNLPLSIIIIGVGDANFTKMQILDGDSGLQTTDGKPIERDLIQFVQFRDFKGDKEQLSRELLQEIPQQVVGYYKLIKMQPPSEFDNSKSN